MKKIKKDAQNREVRFIPIDELEIREEDAGTKIVFGLAAPYERQTDLGYFKETFARGAFKKGIDERRDAFALFHHNFQNVLGRTGAGTLTLEDRADGVHYELDMPDTALGRDLLVSIRRRDIEGVSVSWPYDSVKDEWDHSVDPPERRITEAELVEMSITAIPAYTDTSLAERSLEAARKQFPPANANANANENRTVAPSVQTLRLRARQLR